MKMPTESELRAEFHRLKKEEAEAFAKLKPHQDAYEKKHAELTVIEQKELKPLADKVKAVRDGLGLHKLQREIALLSRALGGETAEPPVVEKPATDAKASS